MIRNGSVAELSTVSKEAWERWLETLYNLRRDKRGDHERPHKPTLLLSVIDLLDEGSLRTNRVELSDELLGTYQRLFAVVRRFDDQPNIHLPFYHLSGDSFWHLKPRKAGSMVYVRGSVRAPKSVAQLREEAVYAEFDPDLWKLLRDSETRAQLRTALITRYFPDNKAQLSKVESSKAFKNPPLPPGRDAAFRKTVLRVYDFTCAACGARVLLSEKNLCLAQAAHLIPFAIDQNDHPTNGIALCPNHHWAMDRNLIAPGPSAEHRAGVWNVSDRLDKRIAGQAQLAELQAQKVIAPNEDISSIQPR